MKICVVTPRYAVAGVPLAQLRFARALAAKGHDVDMLIGRFDWKYPFPDISDVNVVKLGTRRVRGMLIALWKYFRLAKPEVVFSAEDHLNAAVLLAAIFSGSKAKISCSSRVTPFDTYSTVILSKRWLLKQLMRCVMWRADALTCVSKDMVQQYRRVFNSPSHIYVYNIVKDSESLGRSEEQIELPWFESRSCPVLVAAGRLAPWKGFSDLIRAIEILSETKKVKLLILGDGPQREELQALIDDLGLSDSIMLYGYVDNPLKYFKRADVFVLSSLVEGLPNVLVEAMMCGCTPVSTNCPTGPAEVLQDGKYGYLVPVHDPVAMAAAIDEAVNNPIPKEVLAEAIRPFEESAVLNKHFEVLGLV